MDACDVIFWTRACCYFPAGILCHEVMEFMISVIMEIYVIFWAHDCSFQLSMISVLLIRVARSEKNIEFMNYCLSIYALER
jgi:hypothetical protein